MNQKLEITKYVINQLGINPTDERSFKSIYHSIWQNPRTKEKGGYKLTRKGFELLSKSDIKYYEIKLEDRDITFDSKFILWLDRTKIYFFNERPAVQLVLISGNIQKYYRAYQNFATKKNLIDNNS
jgi:hypothetical protein